MNTSPSPNRCSVRPMEIAATPLQEPVQFYSAHVRSWPQAGAYLLSEAMGNVHITGFFCF
jgi:hypothetical protein